MVPQLGMVPWASGNSPQGLLGFRWGWYRGRTLEVPQGLDLSWACYRGRPVGAPQSAANKFAPYSSQSRTKKYDYTCVSKGLIIILLYKA